MNNKAYTRHDICLRCVRFHLDCDGEEYYIKPTEGKRKSCMNFQRSTDMGGSALQVRSFYFLYNALRKWEKPRLAPEECLTRAILLTCDDFWKTISASDKKLLGASLSRKKGILS